MAAGDIEWRGDYFYPETPGAVVAESFTGPTSGYLGRVRVAAGRYALFTTFERLVQVDATTSRMNSCLDRGRS